MRLIHQDLPCTPSGRRLRRLARCGLILAWWTLCLRPAPAWAWQQYKTSLGKAMRWPALALASPVTYAVDETGLVADGVAPEPLRLAIAAGLQAWQGVACGPPCAVHPLAKGFADVGTTAPTALGLGCAATDAFGCSTWAPDGNHMLFVHNTADWPYGKGVIAMTVVSARSESGAIVDADIALNDAGFAFCANSCPPDRVQIEAVFRHEAGHFVGLDHSANPSAVMYGKPPDAITKPTPMTADDEAGLCAAYADDVTPIGCAEPATKTAAMPATTGKAIEAGCAATPGTSEGLTGSALALLGLLGALWRRSRGVRPWPR